MPEQSRQPEQAGWKVSLPLEHALIFHDRDEDEPDHPVRLVFYGYWRRTNDD
jgi:hypothetical protein